MRILCKSAGVINNIGAPASAKIWLPWLTDLYAYIAYSLVNIPLLVSASLVILHALDLSGVLFVQSAKSNYRRTKCKWSDPKVTQSAPNLCKTLVVHFVCLPLQRAAINSLRSRAPLIPYAHTHPTRWWTRAARAALMWDGLQSARRLSICFCAASAFCCCRGLFNVWRGDRARLNDPLKVNKLINSRRELDWIGIGYFFVCGMRSTYTLCFQRQTEFRAFFLSNEIINQSVRIKEFNFYGCWGKLSLNELFDRRKENSFWSFVR